MTELGGCKVEGNRKGAKMEAELDEIAVVRLRTKKTEKNGPGTLHLSCLSALHNSHSLVSYSPGERWSFQFWGSVAGSAC